MAESKTLSMLNHFSEPNSLIPFVWLFIAPFLVTLSYQRTPLHVASNSGHDYTVECLVKKEADMNIKDKTGVCETILLIIV